MKLNAPQHEQPRKFIETPAHTAIFAAIRAATQNIIVEAVAGCLAGDTVIEINRAGKSFKTTINHVVRMHNGGLAGSRRWDPAIPTMVRHRAADGFVRLGLLAGAYASGRKDVVSVMTESGRTITATRDHRFFCEDGWRPLGEIAVGTRVFVDVGPQVKGGPKPPKALYRTITSGMSMHPFSASRGVRSGRQHRGVPVHRLVFEAGLNGLTLDSLLTRIRSAKTTSDLSNLMFIDPSKYTVHHVDENPLNNAIDNLSLMPRIAHYEAHGVSDGWQHVTSKTGLERITSISEAGSVETYDLAMAEEPHNFLANGFVVHNSGKTSTTIECMNLIPDTQTVLSLAFNKRIVEELVTRVPSHVDVKTLNALGHNALVTHLKTQGINVKLDGDKVRRIARDKMSASEFASIGARVVKLVRLAKSSGMSTVGKTMPHIWEELAAHHDVMQDVNIPENIPRIYEWSKDVLRMSCEMTGVIDFDDQLLMTYALDCPMERYDWVFVDECLPYKTPVLLADGTSKSIGEIVDGKLPVEVLAYNTATKTQKKCRVTAWQKIVNQKPLVKIKARRMKTHPSGDKQWSTNFVTCTVDHKVWADGRWIPAGEIKPGMVVQVETSAKKSHHYKITTTGREVLSGVMAGKNDAGATRGKNNRSTVTQRGGNGKPIPLPHALLHSALGTGWVNEFSIPTKKNRYTSGYPTTYKADIAHPGLRCVVEVDGGSHNTLERKAKDEKKDAFLRSIGWTVIRVKNRDAVQHTEQMAKEILAACSLGTCINGDCPVDATVVSVEPVSIPDFHVYDITVEDCHNFYANGILVHNCQDLSPLQHELIAKALGFDGTGRGTGRLVAVGDPFQCVYGFRGVDTQSMETLAKRFGCISLPLHVSYRCPQDVVAFAQRYVGHIQAHEGAPKGTVVYDAKPLHEVKLEIGDMVICRMTAPVVRGAYACIKQGVPAVVLGRDIGTGLLTLIRNLRPVSLDDLTAKIDRWEQVEMGKAIQKQDEAKQAAVEDKAECVRVFIDMAADLSDLTAKIESMFSDARAETVVTFCTIHKSKGLEAERVFIIDFHRMPSKWAKQPWQKQQEINIIYVAITRAKKHLQLVLSGGDPATAVTAERKPEPAAAPVESVPESKWIPVTGNTYPAREKLKAMGRAVIGYNLPHAPKVWSVHPAFKDEAQAIVSGPAASNVIPFRRK